VFSLFGLVSPETFEVSELRQLITTTFNAIRYTSLTVTLSLSLVLRANVATVNKLINHGYRLHSNRDLALMGP
jgi:hypothetical protein